jgi:gamma-glutamyl:cysteine ligase YbdK (ATP-grasp superfamily)
MQIGIELEYWVVDADGELARADGVSSAGDGVETEFVDQLLEVKTPPCETLAELREALAARLERALDAIDGRLVPLGTPLRDGGLGRRGRCQSAGSDTLGVRLPPSVYTHRTPRPKP